MPGESATAEVTETPPGLGAGPGEFVLGDILSDLNSEPEPEATEQTAPAKPAAAKPGKPDPKAAAKGKPAPVAASKAKVVEVEKPAEPGKLKEDFSDDRPWTPERVKAAAAEARELARSAQAQWAREQKRADKLARDREEHLREKGQFKAIRDQFAVDFQALRSGDPKTKLMALGRLAGVDGAQLWEELTLEMVQTNKSRELTPGEKALRAEIAELKAKLAGDEQAKAEQNMASAIERRKVELGELGSSVQTVVDEESGEEVEAPVYPELSLWSAEEIGEALAEVITRVYNDRKRSGQPQRTWRISDAEAAQMLEDDLAARKARRGAPQGVSGLAPRAEKAKPEQAQSPPPKRGRSLAPGLSTQSASRRELTDDEIQEDAADFIPASILRAASPR